MGRPKVPLISREAALATALDIVDREGVDALSIRRLGAEMKINGASLYHHFQNKDAILVGVTELALTRTPVEVNTDTRTIWKRWLLDGARQLRAVLLAHPGLLPIIVRLRTLGVNAEVLDHVAGRLVQHGVPPERVLALFDALERYVIGSVTRDLSVGGSVSERSYPKRTYPSLNLVSSANEITSDALFDAVVMGIIETIHTDPALNPPRRPARRATKAAPAKATPVKATPVKAAPAKTAAVKATAAKGPAATKAAAKASPTKATARKATVS